MRKIDNDIIHENLLKNKPILAFDENVDYAKWKGQAFICSSRSTTTISPSKCAELSAAVCSLLIVA